MISRLMKVLSVFAVMLLFFAFSYLVSVEHRLKGVSDEVKSYSRSLVLSYDLHFFSGGFWESDIAENIDMAVKLSIEYRAEFYIFILVIGGGDPLRSGAASHTYFSRVSSDLDACQYLVSDYDNIFYYHGLSTEKKELVVDWVNIFNPPYS